MATDCLDTVDRISEIIAHKVGQQRYKIWFKNSTKITLENEYIKVGVPNLFIGGWIESHFAGHVKSAANEVTGQERQVIFNIDPELFGGQRRRQLDSQAESVARSTNPTGRGTLPAPRVFRDNLRLKLDDFVVGPSNQLAFSAGKAVVDQPRTLFNPLFIHGACGLGKTHLLQGIYNAVFQARPDVRAAYVSGEEFTNEFVLSLKTNKLDIFRNKYRQAELLIIDDVHFLAGKKATQEEFLHTFNAIDTAGKQVIMASDAHPKMIGQFSEGLVNRFVSGMIVKVDPPEFSTRCAILRQRARKMNKEVSEEVIDYIANNIRANVRELEGALLKVIAYASLGGGAVNLDTAREALEDHISRTDPIVHLSDIEAAVTTFFGITPADVHSSRKTRTISLARSIAMYLARKHTTMSFPEIGRFMGNKNHATVILACRKVQAYLKGEEDVCWETPAGRKSMPVNPLLTQLESAINK